MRVDALVLACGSSKHLKSEVTAKALIEINSRPMVEYVIDSLKASKSVSKIAVVAPPISHSSSWLDKVDLLITSEGTLTENMKIGLSTLNSLHPVLIVSSDIPLITAEAIDDFINQCKKKDVDIFYPIISKKSVESLFPEVSRTYVFLREGIYTGGNVGLVNSQAILNNMETIQRAYKMRKSPVKLLRILGLRFILKFIFRRLAISELEEAVSQLLNSKSKAVVTDYPQIGVDVDKISDLNLVWKVLGSEKETGT